MMLFNIDVISGCSIMLFNIDVISGYLQIGITTPVFVVICM